MHDSSPPGFGISGPGDGRSPLVFASPHSGREYPPAFLAASRLPLSHLRRAEDAMVDALLDGIDGAPVLRARFARTFLDLNRAADEIDPEMFAAPLSIPWRHTDRVGAGLGILPRLATQGQAIYARKLDPADAEARIAHLHRPWHERIGALIERARGRHGYAILVDCHSMPAPPGIRPAQIVLGDRYGKSAAPALVALVERHFAGHGWRVARNAPYAGGYTTEAHGNVAAGVHAIQIEIDRALYMDSVTLARHAGFGRVAAAMAGLAQKLADAAPRLGLGPMLREAAE